MRIFLSLLVCVFILSSCSTSMKMRQNFDDTFREYKEIVRWHGFSESSKYTTSSLRDDFEHRLKTAKDMKVVDLRVVKMKYDSEKGEATVKLEIQYYMLPSNRVKTMLDNQKWSYVEENGRKAWRLVSMPPDFQ